MQVLYVAASTIDASGTVAVGDAVPLRVFGPFHLLGSSDVRMMDQIDALGRAEADVAVDAAKLIGDSWQDSLGFKIKYGISIWWIRESTGGHLRRKSSLALIVTLAEITAETSITIEGGLIRELGLILAEPRTILLGLLRRHLVPRTTQRCLLAQVFPRDRRSSGHHAWLFFIVEILILKTEGTDLQVVAGQSSQLIMVEAKQTSLFVSSDVGHERVKKNTQTGIAHSSP